MAELLNTGMRLRHFRNQCGMTQKALGVAVGFPESSADVRIAQYESGARTPKRELLCRLAAALGVSLPTCRSPHQKQRGAVQPIGRIGGRVRHRIIPTIR